MFTHRGKAPRSPEDFEEADSGDTSAPPNHRGRSLRSLRVVGRREHGKVIGNQCKDFISCTANLGCEMKRKHADRIDWHRVFGEEIYM